VLSEGPRLKEKWKNSSGRGCILLGPRRKGKGATRGGHLRDFCHDREGGGGIWREGDLELRETSFLLSPCGKNAC